MWNLSCDFCASFTCTTLVRTSPTNLAWNSWHVECSLKTVRHTYEETEERRTGVVVISNSPN